MQLKAKISSFCYLLDAVKYLIDGFSRVKRLQDKSLHTILGVYSEEYEHESQDDTNKFIPCKQR